MLRINRDNLVMKAVLGVITHPKMNLKNPYLVDSSGFVQVAPGTGGITYNVSVGDSAFDFAGDHVEPGVSISQESIESENSGLGGLNVLACVGNEARVVSGAAAGLKGVVTGKHGGIQHVLIDFPPSAMEKLVIGDKIQIRSCGQGLRLREFPDVHVMNTDPVFLDKMGISTQNMQLIVPVTHVIPVGIMGSGIGARHSYSGDYDIQASDRDLVRKYGLQNLRIGDIVAINDADCRFGRTVKPGATTIGIVIHGSCITNGHGPGLTVLMTTAKKLIVPKLEESANISFFLHIGRQVKKEQVPRHRRR